VLRGSHLYGEWPTVVGHTIPDQAINSSGLEPVVIAAEPGDVAIMHVLTVHRAGHNYSERGRHAIINEYKSARAIDRWGNSCAFAGLPLARGGVPVLPAPVPAPRL
jgi:ectoine hydroxylase-related dioxygenase (phytanoyl-CoA dioxygenase family)